MTAYSDPQKAISLPKQGTRDAAMAPQVTEKYWGYEITPGETVFDLAALGRGIVLMLAAGAALASLAVWFLPVMAFSAAPAMSKLGLSLMMLAASGLLFWRVFLSGEVRLQVDTARGELREVTSNLFGHDIVLARHGFEAAKDVQVSHGKDFSQVLVVLKDIGPIPAGDGHPLLLEGLEARLRTDLGLARTKTEPAPDFAGPLRRPRKAA